MKKSNELSKVLTYIKEVLLLEAPASEITTDYLLAGMLDKEYTHAHFILETCLMSSNIETMKKTYDDFIREKAKSNLVFDYSQVKYSKETESVLEFAEQEAFRNSSKEIGTEHILLALLNKDSGVDDKTYSTLAKIGLSYSLVLNQCVELQKQIEFNAKCAERQNLRRQKNEQKLMKDLNSMIISDKPSADKVNNLANNKPISVLTSTDNNQILNKFTINLTRLAKEGKLDELVGRDSEMKMIIKTLARKKKNNVILVGNSGCGKTQIGYGFAQLLASNDVPRVLEGKEMLMLNVMALVSGTHLRGMFEERVRTLFDELKKHKKYILFIDNMQYALKSGSKDNDADLSSTLCDILNEGDIRVIGAVTPKAYHIAVESNQAVASKMQKINVEPLTQQQSIEVLNVIKAKYEEFHNVYYPLNVISSAVKLAERYVTDKCLPDSAIDVMDLCGAQTVLTTTEPLEIANMRSRLKELEIEKECALVNCDFPTLDLICEEENKCKINLASYNRQFEKDKDQYKITITEEDVLSVISDMCNIPTSKLSVDEKKKIAHIDDVLKQSVIGQDEAIDIICKSIKRNKVGLNNPNKPLFSGLCIGPSGCGKTLIAKKLAQEIYGDEKALIRIDMSEYSEKSSVAKLTGSSPGYIGFEQGGQLTEAVKNKQYCVVLFDEIEKADESVYNVFLQLLDEGRLTDSSGTLVNFKNVIILMTSNVGVKRANELGGGIGFTNDTESNRKAIINKELRKKFSPEFLNRLDKIVQFNTLSDDNLRDVVKLECNKFAKRLKELNYDIMFDDSVIDYLHRTCLEEKEYGARPIVRLIQDNIEDKVTELMLENEYDKDYCFNVSYNGEIIVK